MVPGTWCPLGYMSVGSRFVLNIEWLDFYIFCLPFNGNFLKPWSTLNLFIFTIPVFIFCSEFFHSVLFRNNTMAGCLVDTVSAAHQCWRCTRADNRSDRQHEVSDSSHVSGRSTRTCSRACPQTCFSPDISRCRRDGLGPWISLVCGVERWVTAMGDSGVPLSLGSVPLNRSSAKVVSVSLVVGVLVLHTGSFFIDLWSNEEKQASTHGVIEAGETWGEIHRLIDPSLANW